MKCKKNLLVRITSQSQAFLCIINITFLAFSWAQTDCNYYRLITLY